MNVLSSGVDESDKFHEHSKLILDWVKERNITVKYVGNTSLVDDFVAMLLPRLTRHLAERVKLKTDIEHFVYSVTAGCGAFVSLNKDILESKKGIIKQTASLLGIVKLPLIYEGKELSTKIKQLKE